MSDQPEDGKATGLHKIAEALAEIDSTLVGSLDDLIAVSRDNRDAIRDLIKSIDRLLGHIAK